MTSATARDQLEALIWRTLPGIVPGHVDALLHAADRYADLAANEVINRTEGSDRLYAAATETCVRVTDLAPHGTRAAYVRHKRNGEQPCEPCIHAFRAYTRNRARARRERARKAAAA